MRKPGIASVSLLLAALVVAPAYGAQIPDGSQQPPIKVTTRLIQVSVVVHDKKGEPLTDLKRGDFTVFDEGKAQKIAFFSIDSSANLVARKPLPPGTFSNLPDRRASVPTSLTVILLDAVNTDPASQAFSRAEIVKFLKTIQPTDRVAIYSLGQKLRIVHDFTNNSESLMRVLGAYKPDGTRELKASSPDNAAQDRPKAKSEPGGAGAAEVEETSSRLEQMLGDFEERRTQVMLRIRMETTLNALTAIANYLGRFPGRKSLLWVSSSFPFGYGWDRPMNFYGVSGDARSFSGEIAKAAQAISGANIAVYPVDPRGIATPADSGVHIGRAPGQARSNISANIVDTQQSMIALANDTGGRAFYNTNDLAKALRAAVADSLVTYSLAFYPDHHDWDGKFREIKVQVKRPNVELRFRRGYFAMPDQPQGEQQRIAQISNAARSPLDATQIGLTVWLDKTTPDGLPLDLHIEAGDLSFEQHEGSWSTLLDSAYLQFDAEGREVDSRGESFPLRFPQATYEKLLKSGLVLKPVLAIKPQAVTLKVLVRDAKSGAIGSLTIPL